MTSSQAMPPEGRYVQAGPIRMHALEYGDAAGPVVVFVHGSGPGNSAYANFQFNIEAFVEAGFRVILPDMIGFGYSDKPLDMGDYTLDLFCDTLMAGLKALDVSSCIFVGNSLGAGVAIQIALNHPEFVNKLVLMGPGCIDEQANYFQMPGIAKMMATSQAGIDQDNLGDVLRHFVVNPSHVSRELIDMRWAVAKDQPREVLTTMKTPNLGPRLVELTCPILTLWGADDAFMPPAGKQLCLHANDKSRLLEINSCGHWVMIEYSRLFNVTAIDFILND